VRVVVQRVSRAAVSWRDPEGKEERREIGTGLAILLGVGPDDDPAQAERLAEKLANLRIFADPQGRTNLSLKDVGGEALVVSQFTLYADLSRGRRPSFIRAADPKEAERLYEHFAQQLAQTHGIPTKTGSFGAHMTVSLDNDGPVTLALSSDDWPTRV
jgi:D-tyrosyl-tRNA(Tyr) deacylase